LPVDDTGSIRLTDLEQAIRPDTILVSLMYVNSEVGRIQPVQAVGHLLAAYPRILFHVDAIQAFGKLDCRPEWLGCDLLSVSGHKFRGPRGAAWLYCREGVELAPLVAGGGQEHGRRAGTENVPAIVGLAKAARLAGERRNADTATLYALRRLLTERLMTVEGVTVSGARDPQLMAPHIVHFTLTGVRSEVMVHALEQADIYISTRSACSSGLIEPSRTLLAMGKSREEASSGLRISFSVEQSAADLEYFVTCLESAIKRVRF
jgi:cysteine desulfurase